MYKTFISRFWENEDLEMRDNLKSLQMSLLYAHMTLKPFKTNIMNRSNMLVKNSATHSTDYLFSHAFNYKV